MVDLSKLKKKKIVSKGLAPKVTNQNLDMLPREKPVAKKKIEFSVTSDVFDNFSEASYKQYGFKKGSKSKFFLAVWEHYRASVLKK